MQDKSCLPEQPDGPYALLCCILKPCFDVVSILHFLNSFYQDLFEDLTSQVMLEETQATQILKFWTQRYSTLGSPAYNTWLLIKLTPKGVVCSFLFLEVQHTLCPTADLFVYQLNAEDTGGLGAPLAEGPLGPFLHQSCLDSPVHVVGVQGSNGQHCLLGRAH